MPAADLDLTPYRPYIEAALEYAGRTHDFDDIVKLVADGRLQAWLGPRSVIITEILNTPKKRLLHVFLAGGHMDEIAAMHDDIIAWSKTEGCVGASMVARPGWTRSFLREHGWVPGLQVLDKDY